MESSNCEMRSRIAACPNPGELTISSRPVEQDDRAFCCLAFRDNGPGISPETAAQVFEPFFTTKQKGTGLGMAIAKRIVDAHGGQLIISTPALGGAEVRLLLPVD